MELQKIRELIDVMKASDLTELEFSDGAYKLKLVRGGGASSSASDTSVALAQLETRLELSAAHGLGADLSVVRSPLYGILHLKAAPQGPTFVQLGSTVQQGETLCIVEAMKIFHEVKADYSAVVEGILGSSGEEVEAGAPLFQLARLG